jgi:transposase
VPYGWQFPGEQVCIFSEKGHKINVFGMISRSNQLHWATTEQNIDTRFVIEQLEALSLGISKETVIVLDCARVHTATVIQERIPYWQKRGLYLFFLPPYSPHLNLAETLWRKIKKEWINPEDYLENDALSYTLNRCLARLGQEICINFSPFNLN